jgi:hypothetical protein
MNKTSEMKVDHFEWNLDEKSRIYIYIYKKKMGGNSRHNGRG